MTDFFKKHTLIAGTILLTATGFATRILGFFYRIFLSRTIGAEGLGIYNLVHPVYGICFSLCAGSVQTAISRFVAANIKKGKAIFATGLVISLSMGFALSFLMYRFCGPISRYVLMEPQCAALLPYMAVSVPFSAVHACINGYYYGIHKTKVPAFAQVVEQVIRICAVFLIVSMLSGQGRPITVTLAVIGHLIGEVASCLFTAACFLFFAPPVPGTRHISDSNGQDAAGSFHASGSQSAAISSRHPHGRSVTGSFHTMNSQSAAVSPHRPQGRAAAGSSHTAASHTHRPVSLAAAFLETAPPLMALALPLMGNRLVLNVLSSAEAIWIPNRLELFGLTASEALKTYGVLTGMAMPFILFPSAITNSMAVLLLPTVAEAQADGKQSRIAQTISMSLRYSLYMGILCIGVFTLFGKELGISVFHDASSGTFMQILAWLCPFLYLATTLGSILNGLGKTTTTFLQNVVALLLRLSFVMFGIPRFGITAYLWGMLASELLLSALHLISLKKQVAFSWDVWDIIVKPALFLVIAVGVYYAVFSIWDGFDRLPLFISTAGHIGVLSFCYGGLLLVFHLAKRG